LAAVTHKFQVELGKMLNAERAAGPEQRPYLRNVNVQWDRIDTDDLLEMDFPPSEHSRYSLRAGDLLICEGGEPGRAAIWHGSPEPMYYQKALHRARPTSDALPRWLYYCLRAATSLNVFAVEGNLTTIAHLTGEQLRAHRFPFPPRQTQERLIAELDDRTRATDATVSAMNTQIELLSERRQALITAAVTGQLDFTTARGIDTH
jgi:type I restriction enzyme S subunit